VGTGTDPASVAGHGFEEAHMRTGTARTVVRPSTVPSCGYSMAPGSSPPRRCSQLRASSSSSQLPVSGGPCAAPIRHRRPSSPPTVQACFWSTWRCLERIQRAEPGDAGGEGQRRGFRAKVYVWFKLF
jgi:hypothetical protein